MHRLRHPDDLPAAFFNGDESVMHQPRHHITDPRVSAKCTTPVPGRVNPNHSGCAMLSCTCPCHIKEGP